ncbi:MAG: hypothetical protein RB191_18795 [Terriglobia bacterium]|nr:hypothetical protein [Terriglobia bacterium]
MITDPGEIMDVQQTFQARLKKHGVTIYFYGTTTIESRWEQIRAAIIGSNFANTPFGKRADGSKESYAEVFERATGTPLIKQENAA